VVDARSGGATGKKGTGKKGDRQRRKQFFHREALG
jgi:hypothetical protein